MQTKKLKMERFGGTTRHGDNDLGHSHARATDPQDAHTRPSPFSNLFSSPPPPPPPTPILSSLEFESIPKFQPFSSHTTFVCSIGSDLLGLRQTPPPHPTTPLEQLSRAPVANTPCLPNPFARTNEEQFRDATHSRSRGSYPFFHVAHYVPHTEVAA